MAPGQIAARKKRLLEGAAELFADARGRCAREARQEKLYEQIGRLEMELTWLKKKLP